LLILHPKGLSDDAIAEMMFPEMKREGALHNLQMATYSLRKTLGRPAILYGARTYQLNPKIELIADVRSFDAALGKARGAVGSALVQSLARAVELYRGPLLADAAWHWLEPVRLEYRGRYISAALQLADALAPLDLTQSDAVAEGVVEVAPETDLAYERLVQNARQRRDLNRFRRLVKRYEQAAAQYDFPVNQYLIDDQGWGTSGRAAH
jgi:DNA-binding SARP family transcriptional activator